MIEYENVFEGDDLGEESKAPYSINVIDRSKWTGLQVKEYLLK